jgi:hypothetical protein
MNSSARGGAGAVRQFDVNPLEFLPREGTNQAHPFREQLVPVSGARDVRRVERNRCPQELIVEGGDPG